MVRNIVRNATLLALFVGGSAFAVPPSAECKIPETPVQTTTGAYVGFYYVDGVLQPGYCTAKTKSGWSTAAVSANPNGGPLGPIAQNPRNNTLVSFRPGPNDQVCSPSRGKGIILPSSSPGPTSPCAPLERAFGTQAFTTTSK